MGRLPRAHPDDKRVKIYTRNGNDWSTKVWPIAEAVHRLKARDAMLDGEVVALDENDVSDFHALVAIDGLAGETARLDCDGTGSFAEPEQDPAPCTTRKGFGRVPVSI